MMLPPPFASITGIACFERRKAPVRLTASVRFQSSSESSIALTGGGVILATRGVRLARGLFLAAGATGAGVVGIDLSEGNFGSAAFGGAFLLFDLAGLGLTADAAQAAVRRGLEPAAFASRVADGTDDLIDLTSALRTADLDDLATSVSLRSSDSVSYTHLTLPTIYSV